MSINETISLEVDAQRLMGQMLRFEAVVNRGNDREIAQVWRDAEALLLEMTELCLDIAYETAKIRQLFQTVGLRTGQSQCLLSLEELEETFSDSIEQMRTIVRTLISISRETREEMQSDPSVGA